MKKMKNHEEIAQLCRLCLVTDQVNKPIFEEASNITQILLKIQSCLPVTISQDDNLPKSICDGCFDKLDLLYQFWTTSANSEKQLISWLSEAGIEPKLPPKRSKMATKTEADQFPIKQEFQEEVDDGQITNEYILQQQKLPYKNEFSEKSEDEPPPKRARRAAAQVKVIMDEDSDDDYSPPVTKNEDNSEDDSDRLENDDDDSADFPDEPSTSADQPGPSGVTKAVAEAPFVEDLVQVILDEDKKMCCGKEFPKANTLRKHIKQHHQPKEFECTLCSKKFATKYQLKNHSQTHITLKSFSCTLCERTFKSDKYLENHMKYNHLKGGFRHKCTTCDKSYRSEKELAHHVGSKHEGIMYKCDVCYKDFTSDFYLKKHSLQHIEGYVAPTVPCKLCDKVFSCKRSLTVHVESFHDGIRHICEICGKSLSTQYSLRLHKRTHSDEKPFACEVCDKRFAKSSTRQDHLRVHTKQRPHICPECGKGFTQRTPLITHLKSVHGTERPFQCAICFKGFATKSLLKTHSKAHGTPLGDMSKSSSMPQTLN